MKNSNSLKEQKGLKILNIDNLDIFITECNELPERFKSQYISEKNGLTLLILQVGDKLAELLKFQDTIERDTYEEEVQIAFCKFLGFDDDEHFAEWLEANPQWAPEDWCGSSYCIFDDSQHQGFASARATTYEELINELYKLYGHYKFKVYDE
jgi:hypothetical protein